MPSLPTTTIVNLPLILVFDAKCLLCSAWVTFILDRDKEEVFQFAALQSSHGRKLLLHHGLDATNPSTLLLVKEQRAWTDTRAIIQVLHQLGWPWRLAWLGWLIPWFLRDAVYRVVARNRHRIFGSSPVCMLSPEASSSRFLD